MIELDRGKLVIESDFDRDAELNFCISECHEGENDIWLNIKEVRVLIEHLKKAVEKSGL